MSTLEEVLTATRLTTYSDQLNEHGCELDDLLDHDTKEDLDNTLQDLGITTLMHRRRLQKKIWEIKTANNNNNNSNNNNNNNNNNNGNNNNNSNTNNNNNNNNRNNNDNNNIQEQIRRMQQENDLLRARYQRERLEREEEARRARELEEQQQQLRQQRQRQFENSGIEELINDNTNNNNTKFSVQYDQGDSTFVKPGFERSETVKALYKGYAKYIYGQDGDSLLTRFELTFAGTTLTQNDWNNTLESIGMGTNLRVGDTVSVVMLVNGGTTISRTLRENEGYVIVEGECCILKMVEKCAKMEPCNHLISSYAMFHYIKSIVTKNEYAYQVFCPVSNCGKLWDWNKCCAIGDLTQEEYMAYTVIVRRRQKLASGAFKNCPHCKILIKRPDKLGKNRLQCGRCKNKDFCYICLKNWISGGVTLCGNNSCPLYEKQKKLLNCPKIEKDDKHRYDYYRTLNIPVYRACPKCYRFIKHQAACKHMCCPGCGLSFCFICLGLYNKQTGKWPCMLNGKNTGSSLGCNLAPRQRLG